MKMIERDTLFTIREWCSSPAHVYRDTIVGAVQEKYHHKEKEIVQAVKDLCYAGYVTLDLAGHVRVNVDAIETVKQLTHLCHWCGLSCIFEKPSPISPRMNGLIDAKASGGYDSTPGNGEGTLDDGTTYRFSLCEWCVDHLFAQFKYPPIMFDYMSGEEQKDWKPAATRVMEEDWRKGKKEFFEEFEKRNAARGRK